MNPTDAIETYAREQQMRAWEIIRETRLMEIWQSIGAEVRLVGSLRCGLLARHRDIDLHIYSAPLHPDDSFAAMARLAVHPAIERIECRNLLATDEACIEWHAFYRDRDNGMWQIDMIHIRRGSRYDGHFERVADRIAERFTPEMKRAVLRLKYETPDSESIPGVEYYHAVQAGGVRTFAEFTEFRKHHPAAELIDWMPA